MYTVIKPYTTYYFGFPLILPVGTKLRWFDQVKCYLADAVEGYCAPVEKWAAEAWQDYFRKDEG